jgi:hypothetical protein
VAIRMLLQVSLNSSRRSLSFTEFQKARSRVSAATSSGVNARGPAGESAAASSRVLQSNAKVPSGYCSRPGTSAQRSRRCRSRPTARTRAATGGFRRECAPPPATRIDLRRISGGTAGDRNAGSSARVLVDVGGGRNVDDCRGAATDRTFSDRPDARRSAVRLRLSANRIVKDRTSRDIVASEPASAKRLCSLFRTENVDKIGGPVWLRDKGGCNRPSPGP